MRRKVSEFDYGKGEFGGGGVDVRGAGGGGGNFRSPAAVRARVIRANSTAETTQPVREFAAKSLRQIIENTSAQGRPTDEFERQRYLKGERYASGGFVKDFARGMNRGMGMGKKKPDDTDTEELFPDAPGAGLYRKGGMVKGCRDYGKASRR